MTSYVLGILKDIAIAIAGAIVGAIVITWWQRLRSRSPFARVTAVNRLKNTIIVVPPREPESTPSNVDHPRRIYVTYEDMLAANYAERTLTLAGLHDNEIEVCNVREFTESRDARQNNIILLCSPRANPVTLEALDALKRTVHGFDVHFEKIQDKPERWVLCFWSAVFHSDSYAQEDALIRSGVIPGEGNLDDFAVIIRAPNPWNPETRLFIISGIRGIGTWGAARYLRSHTAEILRHTDGNDFAAVVKIGYESYKIPHRTLMNIYPLSGPPPMQHGLKKVNK